MFYEILFAKLRYFTVLLIAICSLFCIASVSANWELYVSSSANSKIWRYDGLTGVNTPAPGQTGALFASTSTGLQESTDMAMGPDGTLYVSNATDVKHYNCDTGANLGQFIYSTGQNKACALSTNADGFLYVSWRNSPGSIINSIVMRYEFTETDTLLGETFVYEPGQVGYSYDGIWLPDKFVVADNTPALRFFEADGTPAFVWTDQAEAITDVCYDAPFIYIACPNSISKIKRFIYNPGDNQLVYDSAFQLNGYSGDLGFTAGVTVGPDRNLYVSQWYGNAILRFNVRSGAYIGSFIPAAQGGLNKPYRMLFVNATNPGIQGLIGLKNYTGAKSSIPVAMEILNGTQVLETHNVPIDASGRYWFATNLRGGYTLSAKASHWLRQAKPITITGGMDYVDFSLTNGDCNGDNGIDEIDYAMLSNAWYQAEGDPAYNANADLNGDGGVDEIDYAVLSNAWYTAGD